MTKAIKQLLVLTAVIAITMVFVIQFRPGTNVGTSGGPHCAIEISGECVPRTDYSTALRLAAPNGLEDKEAEQARKLVLDGLIERWLLNNDADRLGLSVSDDDVSATLGRGLVRVSLPAAQEDFTVFRYRLVGFPDGPAKALPVLDPKTGKFEYKRYQRMVRRLTTKTEKDFREYQRKELLAARMRALVKSRVRVSDAEAYARYARDAEKLVVDYIALQHSFYADHVLDHSVEAIDKWAEANKEAVDEKWKNRKDGYLPTCRQARHILVRVDDTADDKEAAKKAAHDKLAAARKRIKNGESFADVARDISEDTTTAKEGGALGCFAAGKLARPNVTKPVDDAAFALEEGKLSDDIESRFGLHLVRVDSIHEGADAEKVGRHAIAKELYEKAETGRLAAEGAKQILAAVKAGKTLQQALDSHLSALLNEEALAALGDSRPQIKTSDPFARNTPPFAQVQAPTEAARMLFELKEPGQVPSDIIPLLSGYAVAQLKERKAADKKGFAEERERYVASLLRTKRADALLAYVQDLRDKHKEDIVMNVRIASPKASTK